MDIKRRENERRLGTKQGKTEHAKVVGEARVFEIYVFSRLPIPWDESTVSLHEQIVMLTMQSTRPESFDSSNTKPGHWVTSAITSKQLVDL